MKKSCLFCSMHFLALVFLLFFSCSDMESGFEFDSSSSAISIERFVCDDVALTGFSGGISCKKNIRISGAISGGKKISSVRAQLKWSGENFFVDAEKAEISGNSWTCDLSFDRAGVVLIQFVSELSDGGTQISSRVITMFVDDDASFESLWYIDREINSIQYQLGEKEELASLDPLLPENKDAFQNTSFSICLRDTVNLEVGSLQIRGEDGSKICDVENSAASGESPRFLVTQKILSGGDSSLSEGTHYLQAVYVLDDTEIEAGWFVWSPERDFPQILSEKIEADGSSESMSLYSDEEFSLTIFDDDELDKAYLALLTEDEASSFSAWSEIADNPAKILDFAEGGVSSGRVVSYSAASGEREASISLKAAASPQTMRLFVFVQDRTSSHLVSVKEITVRVLDKSKPALFVTSPEDGVISSIIMSDSDTKAIVPVSGYTLDSVGCAYLEFVWVPGDGSDDEKNELAQDWLESISGENAHESLKKIGKTTRDGMTLWAVNLSDSAEHNSFYRQTFSFDIDLISDFFDEKNSDKFFVAKLTRSDGNYSYSVYKLLADSTRPVIEPFSPAETNQVVQSADDFVLEFGASKENSLSLDISMYALYRVDVSPRELISSAVDGYSKVGYNAAEKTFRATVSSKLLEVFAEEGVSPEYEFVAVDLLGNESRATYKIVVSNLPSIKNISYSAPSLCKAGDEIEVSVLFSGEVTVDFADGGSGIPYIKLSGIKNDSSFRKSDSIVPAYYKSGSGSKTLVFSYIVQAGDSADELFLSRGDTSSPIEANGSRSLAEASIVFSKNSAKGKLFPTDSIVIDAIPPRIAEISVNVPSASKSLRYDGPVYLRTGMTLSVSLTASEALSVTGNPSFVFTVIGEDGSAGTLALPFANCKNSIVTFAKKISGSETNGTLYYSDLSVLSENGAITDEAGNVLFVSESSEQKSARVFVDTVPPVVTAMSPSGETESRSNIYKNADTISLTFSEEIQKADGKIFLRQVADWAIPPVLSKDEFARIRAELSDDDKEILSRQENGTDMLDSESVFASDGTDFYPNDTYHGTGQFVGPYKLSTQGLLRSSDGTSYVPDLSEKYVLDFDIGIWETDTEHYFDKTFVPGYASQKKYESRASYESLTNTNVFKVVDPQAERQDYARRTAAQIRAVLEKIHYHERVIDVNSSFVVLSDDKKTVIVTLGESFSGSVNLEDGREWELVIEKGAFSDMAGNEFGAESDGSIALSDSIQEAGGIQRDFSESEWKRGRDGLSHSEKPVVLIQNVNGENSFWSDKVAAPVVRVDRYSYGLGIWQSDAYGNKSSQVIADLSALRLDVPHDSIQPTAFVRTRIDCETRGATIYYAKSNSPDGFVSEDKVAVSPSDSAIFASGNGQYNTACVQYIICTAEKDGFNVSEQGIEGIYQTVVHFSGLSLSTATVNGAVRTIGQRDVSIRGSEGEYSYISFPLRSSQNGTPYLRRCFREESVAKDGGDYYWVSYEILSPATFSYYGWTGSRYEWAEEWGALIPGGRSEFVQK